MRLTSELPRGWRAGPLSSYCLIASGSTPKTDVPEYWDGDIPWLTPDDLSKHQGKSVDGGRRRLSQAGFASCSTRLVPAGSVLYSSRAPIGYVAIASRPLCTNQGFKSALPNAEFMPDFLYWQLIALTPSIRAAANGTTFKEISGKAFGAVEVVVPPLDEQQRIVAVIEDHLSRLEAGVAYVMAGRRRGQAWRQRCRDEQLQAHAAQTCRLADLVERVEAGRSFGGAAPPAGADEWGVLRVSAMTWGEFRPGENKAVPAGGVDPRWEVRKGDVLVSRANTSEYVGAPVLVPDVRPRLLLSDKSLRLVPAKGVDPAWLVEALASTPARRQITALASGTKDSMRNISQANLLGLRLPKADLAGQRMVVEASAAARESAARLAAELESAQERAAALRRSLLSAAFAGRL